MKVGGDVSLSNKNIYVTSILPRRELRVFELKRSPLKVAMEGWAGPSILILLFVASAVYVVFGGAFELEASPDPKVQTSMAAVALESSKVSDSARVKKVSGSSAGKVK